MASEVVNEKKPFNCKEDNVPFYIDCIRRTIHKKSPPAIFHYHTNIELLYCVKGELEVTLFPVSLVLKEGDFLYLAPNTPHSTSAKSDTNEHICIKFLSQVILVPASRKIPPVDYYISLTPDYKLFSSNDADGEHIKDLFYSCIRNYSHDDYTKRLVLCADIMQIMSYVFSHSIKEFGENSPKTVPDVFIKVLKYIDSNSATVTLEEAADYCSLSYSYFS